MAWAEPQHDQKSINKAGRILLNTDWNLLDYLDSFPVINNFRASHAFPLNTFQMYLRKTAKRIDDSAQIAQRIKRLNSIEYKLKCFPSMRLSQMQDIGGCRAIFSSSTRVYEAVLNYKKSDIKHKLVSEKDYISEPQKTGYRGYHLVYEYYSDKKPTYNGLKVEIQLRSRMQHAWATSVEVVGALVGQALKSNAGEQDWLRLFALMGSVIAEIERSPLVPETPALLTDLQQGVRALSIGLDAINRLRTYSHAVKVTEPSEDRSFKYYLMTLDVSTQALNIIGYGANDSERAASDYLHAERDVKSHIGMDAVLVSVDSLDALRKAYPNYFLDIDYFLRVLRRFIDRKLG